jgi:putative nucleotidyltransferase with HDIG domain
MGTHPYTGKPPERKLASVPSVPSVPSVSRGPTDPYATRERHHNEGHGRRLTAAFEALETFPALAESRNQVMRLFESGEPSTAEVVAAVEGDVALAVTVLRLANRVEGRGRGRVDSVVKAAQVLTPHGVRTIASRARTFDFFQRSPMWKGMPERFRLHAIATQRAADRLARELSYDARDRLMITSLLHDIGKLVLVHAYPGYPRQVHGEARTPEERLNAERRELGVDHALVGGVLARRWSLPRTVASAIERHHAEDAQDDAAVIRLADMLAHYALGGAVSPAELLKASRAIGVTPQQLRSVMYDLPLAGSDPRPRAVDPCPMSKRELEVVRRLARGMVYKQIAGELGLSTSTIRTHLHNIYGKLGARDRAQAVLIATERGWL